MFRIQTVFTALPLAASALVASVAVAQQRDVMTTETRGDRPGDLAAEYDDGANQGPELLPAELRLTCGDAWLTIYEEDENGQPVPGSYDYECLYDEDT